MIFIHKKISFVGIIIVIAFLLTACVTQIKTSTTNNPPPSEAFVNFTTYEIKPVTLASEYAKNDINQKALAKIQKNLATHLSPLLEHWNQAGAAKAGERRTLIIEPVVTEIKFVNGAGRFFIGPMAGSSAVIMRVTITEKETGKTVASPEFYDKAGAWSGGWSVGATDNKMLNHIADKLKDYLVTNYTAAIGGPTGAQEK